MRKVFDNRQCCHVWAQQTQPEGRAPSIFFDGATIYSYGRHFPMARFIEGRDGARAVLFTTCNYSVTTSRHKSYARNAIPSGVPVFHVPDVNARPSDIRESYKARASRAMEEAARARKPDNVARAVNQARAIVAEANDYAKFTGQRWRLKEPQLSPEQIAAYRERLARLDAREKAKRVRIKAANAAALAEQLAEWRAGGSRHMSGLDFTALRVHGDEIQTSRGARVPLSVAPMVWEMATTARDNQEGRGFDPPPRLGEFTLDAVTADGTIHAGCHVIGYDELSLIAAQLGYLKVQL
jgi:hypothetical protein